jgi:hypothetical protein
VSIIIFLFQCFFFLEYEIHLPLISINKVSKIEFHYLVFCLFRRSCTQVMRIRIFCMIVFRNSLSYSNELHEFFHTSFLCVDLLSFKGLQPQIQVKFHMPFLILTVLYHGIPNGHTKYEFQILS